MASSWLFDGELEMRVFCEAFHTDRGSEAFLEMAGSAGDGLETQARPEVFRSSLPRVGYHHFLGHQK
jgi:hypothetical protein